MRTTGVIVTCAGLALACVLVVAGCAGSAPEPKTGAAPTPTTSAAATEPAAAATTSAESGPPAPRASAGGVVEAGIGQKADVEGWTLEVLGAQPEPEVEDRPASSGKQFILVPMNVTNHATAARKVGIEEFVLAGAGGKLYDEVQTHNPEWLPLVGTVPAGATVMTVAVYEVPTGTKGLVLSFRPKGEHGTKAAVTLQ